MKALILIALIAFSGTVLGQDSAEASTAKVKTEKTKKAKKSKNVKTSITLTNVLVIGQLDKPEDRYSIEINLAEMFTERGVKAVPSLNVLKLGSDSRSLASDSMQRKVLAKGVDTYCVATIRGFDRKYSVSNTSDDFATTLDQASFFELYREEAVSISFQFKFFRDNVCVHSEIVKCGNIGSRETVLKRFRKKVGKRITKAWTK